MQILSNQQEAILQSNLIKTRISAYQGSSPTPIIDAVDRLAKGTQALAYLVTLLTDCVHTLEKANIVLSKYRRAKKSRVQYGGALSIEDSQAIITEKDKGKCPAADNSENSSLSKRTAATAQYCSNCSKTSHNTHTCNRDIEMSTKSDSN